MTPKHLSFTLALAALLLGANPAIAQVHEPAHPTSKTSAPADKLAAKPGFLKAKRDPKVKLVDINAASKAALKKLPGITDADADKIVANRPYGSKAWLVTHNVIPEKTYHGLSALIQAGQAFKAPPDKSSTSTKAAKQ
jgi:DNA uptake protein ComE-like DNA-binding protein